MLNLLLAVLALGAAGGIIWIMPLHQEAAEGQGLHMLDGSQAQLGDLDHRHT